MADVSVHSMLSNCAGILLSSVYVGNNIPYKYKIVEENASKGLMLSQRLLAEACGVPTEMVHFLPKGCRLNIDDMASVYSTEDGFSVPEEEKFGLVPEESVNGMMNRGYSVHREASEKILGDSEVSKGGIPTYLLTVETMFQSAFDFQICLTRRYLQTRCPVAL